MNFILFCTYPTENNFVSRLLIPAPVKMTGTRQSVKGSYTINHIPRFVQFAIRF